MTRLLIDITFLINELKRKRPPHGIPRVILAYLNNYQKDIQVVYRVRKRIFILSNHYSQSIIKLVLLWQNKFYKNILLLIVKGIITSKKTDRRYKYFLLKLDQNGMKYPQYFQQLEDMRIHLIIMIHDLFPIFYPEYSDQSYARRFENNILLSIKSAKGLLCVSKNTEQFLNNYVKKNKLTSPPTIASPLASVFFSSPSPSERPIKEAYFIMISTLVARKNHLLLLNIWRELVNEFGNSTPKLVIIGKRSSECSSTLAMLDRCQQIKESVIEITASDKELHHYLSHAVAMLFPSFAEGYGLPLIEALSMGIPVIASDLPIFREIATDIPDYIAPIDGKGWMQTILDYTQYNSPKRLAQLQRIAQFKAPTWQEHFNTVGSFINQLPD